MFVLSRKEIRVFNKPKENVSDSHYSFFSISTKNFGSDLYSDFGKPMAAVAITSVSKDNTLSTEAPGREEFSFEHNDGSEET